MNTKKTNTSRWQTAYRAKRRPKRRNKKMIPGIIIHRCKRHTPVYHNCYNYTQTQHRKKTQTHTSYTHTSVPGNIRIRTSELEYICIYNNNENAFVSLFLFLLGIT